MPELVHLLLKPRLKIHDLARYEQRAKLSWSRKMIVDLKRIASPLLEKLKVGTGYRVWQAGGGHDLNIWTKISCPKVCGIRTGLNGETGGTLVKGLTG